MAGIVKRCCKWSGLLFLFSIFSATIIYLLLNSSQFYELVIPKVVESKVAGIKLGQVKIERVRYRFPDQFRFKNVEADLTQNDDNCSIKIISLGIDNLRRVILKNGSTDISVSLRSFSTKNMEVNYSDLQLTLLPEDNQSVRLEGKVFIAQSVLADYQVNNAEIMINGNLNRIGLTLKKASFYGGDLAGQIWLENKPLTAYKADLKFTLLTTARLDEIYRELNANFNGLISGTISVTGNTQDVELIKLSLQAVSGTKIKAWVFSWLISNVPKIEILLSKELKNIIRQNGFLTTDYLNLDLKNTSARTLLANVNITLRKYNWNPNYIYDISIDGRLLEAIKKVEHNLKTGGFYGPR